MFLYWFVSVVVDMFPIATPVINKIKKLILEVDLYNRSNWRTTKFHWWNHILN